MGTAQAIAQFLDAATGDDNCGDPTAILSLSTEADADPFLLHQVEKVVFNLWSRLNRSQDAVDHEVLDRLVRTAGSRDGVSFHVRTALDYLFLWSQAKRYLLVNRLEQISYGNVVSDVESVLTATEALEGCATKLTTRYGPLMFEAMLSSLINRPAAAALFEEARDENPQFASVQRLDSFAASYLSSETIMDRASEIADRRSRLLADFEVLSEPAQGADESTLVVFSCDLAFFARFFPYWASTAGYLASYGIRMHFIVAGNPDETGAAYERGVDLAGSIAKLRGIDLRSVRESLSFSAVTVPEYVERPNAFYASLRFLLARELASRINGRLLILDIDMKLRGDPANFLPSIYKDGDGKLPLMMSKSGLCMLIPARRYLAGCFLLPKGELGERAMVYLEDYTYAGLSCATPWTLDQNAIAYAAEQVIDLYGPEAVVGSGSYARAFVQMPSRRIFRMAS